MHKKLRLAAMGLGLLACAVAAAQTPAPPSLGLGSGKLLLTGGVSSIDGASGGGLTPWATTGSYATEGEVGATAFATRAVVQKFALTVVGAAASYQDRAELSLARQQFNANVVVPDTTLKLDVVGIKIKLAGDAVLDSDRLMPQITIGAQFKHATPGPVVGGILDSVSAKRSGVDLYASAIKLLLAHGVLLNATLRATKANQNGLLGFGSAEKSGYGLRPEFSAAWLLRRDVAVGVEYRAKPDNLNFAGAALHEDDWKDLFIAWAPNKRVSLTAAYVDLGNVVGNARQHGAYLSAQIAF